MKPLRVALRVISCQRANALPTGNIMGEMDLATSPRSERRWPQRCWPHWVDTYQRRRKYQNKEASVEWVPNMSRKACERSPIHPNQGEVARHVETFRYQIGSNPHEYVACIAVASFQVVRGLRG